MSEPHPALELAEAVADLLHHPQAVSRFLPRDRWYPQSLATGAPGIALLHVELAALGIRPWQRVHDWLTSEPHFVAGPESNPYYGAPAFAHAMAAATRANPNAYQRALSNLDTSIDSAVLERIGAARSRLDRAQLPVPAEFDTIRGLAGYGAYLLCRAPQSDTLRAILSYLVSLVVPIAVEGHQVPGWWCQGAPSKRLDDQFSHGHSSHGVAHGIGGPLALLSLAAIRGIHVVGQLAAIHTICAWLDGWETTNGSATNWPYWINLTELGERKVERPRAQRPSWCYGTAGLGRALQLAAIATDDSGRKSRIEAAVANTLTDQATLTVTTDVSLCHGFAGLARLVSVLAADAAPQTAKRLRARALSLFRRVHETGPDPQTVAERLLTSAAAGPGLLDGAAGTALAGVGATVHRPQSCWDTCLLIV
jgi:hypothetical protein